MKNVSLYRVIIVLWLAGSYGAVVFDPDTEAKVRSFIDSTMQCRKVPGMTMSVVKDNDTWTSGFGIADVDTGRQVNSQSQFGIGSCTKAFTMTLLGMLLDEHGFKWSSKVSEVLGYELKFVDELRTKEMTIRDMLSHRSGLARLDIGLMAGYTTNMTTRAGLSEKIQYLPAEYDFRDKFLYNNFIYMLSGHVCEVLGKDSWENLVTSRLLKPLGMTSTVIMRSPNDAFSGSSAQPHIYKDERFQKGTRDLYYIFPTEPAGAILSSAEDMAKWMLFNLRGGKLENGTQLVKKELLDEAITGTTSLQSERAISKPEFPVSNVDHAYGYAWITANYRGYQRYWHSGGLFSYITYLWIFPDSNIGLFASVNGPGFKSSETLQSLFYYVSDLLLGEETWMNETTACTYPEPWRENESKNDTMEETGQFVHATDYVGTYGNAFLPDVKISSMPTGQSELRIDSNRISGTLRPSMDKDRFLFEVTSPWELSNEVPKDDNITSEVNVTFIRKDGEVTAAMFSYEVNVTYTKGTSFTDQITSGALTFQGIRFGYFLAWSLTCFVLGIVGQNII